MAVSHQLSAVSLDPKEVQTQTLKYSGFPVLIADS